LVLILIKSTHKKNDYEVFKNFEVSKNITADLKIILVNYQNNHVESLNVDNKAAKKTFWKEQPVWAFYLTILMTKNYFLYLAKFLNTLVKINR